MDLLISLKKLIDRINEINIKSKNMSKERRYSSNPFAFTQNKTYVWVDRVKDFNKCSWFSKGFFKPKDK